MRQTAVTSDTCTRKYSDSDSHTLCPYTRPRFEGKRPKVGDLQKAAGAEAAEGYGYAKKNGSRAGGAQGEAGKRAAPEKAAGGPARRPAVSVTPNQRDARLMLIPKLMSDLDDMISVLTKQKDEFIAASNSAAAITVINTLSEKRVERMALQEELRQLQAKGKKAAADKRRSAGEGALLEQLSTPEVSAANIPAATTSELETVKLLADQLAVKDSFAKESTEIGRLRVSPIDGITLEEYVMAGRHLCSARGHSEKTVCPCNVLIRAATVLVKKRGERVSMRQLWKDAGGSSGVTKARNILDQLMHIPIVAVRLGTSTGEQTSWIVMAKEPDVNYKMLDGMVGAVEPALSTPALSSKPMISTARLRALKRLCSTDSDRKLVELAVLEGQGLRARRELLGTNRAPSREARAELEEKIEAALATFEVCAELANLQTLSEVTARIGCGQITEQDIADEVACLEADERKYAAEAEGGEARGDSGAAAAGNGLGTGAAAAGEGEDATDLLEAAITGPEEPDASWAAKIPSAEDVERVRAELEAMGITNLETLKAADADAKTILGDNWDEYAMGGIDFWSEANTPYSSDGRLIRPLSGSPSPRSRKPPPRRAVPVDEPTVSVW